MKPVLPRNPLVAVAIVLFTFVASQAIGLTLTHVAASFLAGSLSREAWFETTGAQFCYILFAEAITVLLLWLFLFRRGSLREILVAIGLSKPQWNALGHAIAGVLVYFAAYIFLAHALSSFLPIDTEQEQAVGFEEAKQVGELAIVFISLVVLPPLIEEIVFRGFLYSAVRRQVGIAAAFIITSVVFAALHLLGSADGAPLWIAAIDTFVLSIVLCYLREKTGSLWAPIGVHALKNGVAFTLLFVVGTR